MKLNIGCATNFFPFPGWVNYDRENVDSYIQYLLTMPLESMSPEARRKAEYLRGGGLLDFRIHDLRMGFAHHEADSVDGIYLGQIVEHLNPIYEIPRFLQDCCRMLKPGAVLRIATPNLDLLIDAYREGRMADFNADQPEFYKGAHPASQLSYMMFGASGPRCTWNYYEGHMHLYTPESMWRAMRDAGFREQVNDPAFDAEVFDAGMSHSFVIEAIK